MKNQDKSLQYFSYTLIVFAVLMLTMCQPKNEIEFPVKAGVKPESSFLTPKKAAF